MAIGQYHRALLYLKAIDASQKNPAEELFGQSSVPPMSPQQRHDVDQLYADCQSNLAGKACNLIALHICTSFLCFNASDMLVDCENFSLDC